MLIRFVNVFLIFKKGGEIYKICAAARVNKSGVRCVRYYNIYLFFYYDFFSQKIYNFVTHQSDHGILFFLYFFYEYFKI